MKNYDVIVIGAGSIGLPVTYLLAKEKLEVLCLDGNSAAGQGQNKAAIGGIRAAHSEPAKIEICKKSLQFFSSWKEKTGDDIGWKEGGYCFPVYGRKEEKMLKSLLPLQQAYDLRIDWVNREAIQDIIPGISPDGLIGGTFSPNDGQASPLLTAESFMRQAKKLGARFVFGEKVTRIEKSRNRIVKIHTQKESYGANCFVNAAGIGAVDICKMIGCDAPIAPESHEAGISAPVRQFLNPLIVDLRPGKETANFYFGQNAKGKILFCYTPERPFKGVNRKSTSEFMPIAARRLVNLMPRLKNLLVRRVWRGLYPMTPDGIPIVGRAPNCENLYLAIGLCGQGFMLGPGIAQLLTEIITGSQLFLSPELLVALAPNRDFNKTNKEALK